MEHRDEALRHAMEFSRGSDINDTDRFVRMYVNEYTLDMGVESERAIRTLLEWASERGLTPRVDLAFV